MVAALVYWTVALGLGGLSLMAVSAFSTGETTVVTTADVTATDTGGGGVGMPRDGFEPILVRIEESAEPEDVDDNAGCGLTDAVALQSEATASDSSLRGPSAAETE